MSDSELSRLPWLPFAEQLELVDRVVARGQGGETVALLRATARLRDHGPLAHALGRLATGGALANPEVSAALGEVFAELPDTGLLRLLRAFDGVGDGARSPAIESLIAAVAGTVRRFGVERLAATCLLDRWLKNIAPAERASLVDEAEAAARAAISEGRLDELDDGLLVRIPGSRLAELGEQAWATSGALGRAWQDRLCRFAGAVLEVLGAMPKSLSQANAEELLSRRVYTDPGHFLVELLQNAEDAGARRWQVAIGERAVRVWHDGVPFDARDVVGVLSIGQTTKQRQQIGFFGVGFKSVYEVCGRPQVYSPPFAFEIADVSIPRQLEGRPAGAPSDGTLLVLPLRDPADPLRDAHALAQRALAVPPETLLTLTSLACLEVRHGDRCLRRVERVAGAEQGRYLLRLAGESGTGERRFLVEQQVFDGPARDDGYRADPHRATRTPVLVGVALDEAGVPRPLPAGGSTVFSYLPTAERSGLRLLVHGHFDLPIDRERLDRSSAWNRWILARAGELLARIAGRLVDELDAVEQRSSGGAAVDQAAARIDALLEVLPHDELAGDELYRGLLEGMLGGLAPLPLWPGADGRRLVAGEAAVADEQPLAGALAGVALGPQGRQPLAALSPRASALAAALGVPRVGAEEVVALLEAMDGTGGADQDPPWLAAALPVMLDLLGRRASPEQLARLGRLRVLPDGADARHRPTGVLRASAELRAIYLAGEGQRARPLLAELLDLAPSEGQRLLLEGLGVAALGLNHLLVDLRQHDGLRQRLAGGEASRLLLAYLARQPLSTLRAAELGGLALFAGEDGEAHPLTGEGAAWLPPAVEALGRWLAGLGPRRPPLLTAELVAERRDLLEGLGAAALELAPLIELITEGALDVKGEDLGRLHQAFAALRPDLSERACAVYAGAALFADVDGELRPLVGVGRALVARDDGLPAVLPDVPWIAAALARLPALASLPGVEPVGPSAVIAALLLEGGADEGLVAATWARIEGSAERSAPDGAVADQSSPGQSSPGWAGLYGYLATHAGAIAQRVARELAGAPVWADTAGAKWPLAELRLAASSPALARFYAAWGERPMIESQVTGGGASALELARALGLQGELHAADHRTLVADLLAVGERAGRVAREPSLRQVWLEAVGEGVGLLDAADLAPVLEAPVFRRAGGGTASLGRWPRDAARPAEAGCCFRASGVLREALEALGVWLLAEEEERELAGLLEHLDVAQARLVDLVTEVEARATALDQPGAAAVRRALIAVAAEAAELEELEGRLARLRIWPAEGGGLLGAESLHRPARLRELFGEDWREMVEADGWPLVAAEAEAEADALADQVGFGDPVALLVARVEDATAEGEPLERQPAFVNGLERLLRVIELVAPRLEGEALGRLPLSVDVAGRLVRGGRLAAEADEIALARGLPLSDDLADPDWAAGVASLEGARGLAPRLLPRRLLLALREAARPLAADQRPALYRWLLASAEAIERDVEARGILARAPLLPTASGELRAPVELLFDGDLAELIGDLPPGTASGAEDWQLERRQASAELPEPLADWLRRSYALEDKRLERLLSGLLATHDEAVAAADPARSAALLRLVARVLAPRDADAELLAERVAALPKSIKLRRQVRVATAGGGRFVRPRQLLLPSAEHVALLGAFCVELPPRPAPCYLEAPELEALLLALGARRVLASEALAGLLAGNGRQPGAEAALAQARYIAEVLGGDGNLLRQELALDGVAWIPDGEGDPRAPGELHWPDAETVAVLGPQPSPWYPHPELVAEASGLAERLSFAALRSASLDAVVGRLAEVGQAPEELLEWLEEGIGDGSLDRKVVREALAHRRFLVDDAGVARAPRELFRAPAEEITRRFGGRRGGWRAGRELRRLADALGVGQSPGVRDGLRFCEEVAVDIEALAAEGLGGEVQLADEPELSACLARNLAVLATARRPPAASEAIAVPAYDAARGAPTIAVDDDPRLLLPEPPELQDVVLSQAVPVRLVDLALLDHAERGAEARIGQYLAGLGVATLGQRWTAAPLPERLGGEVTGELAEQATGLGRTIEGLLRAAPRLRARLRHLPREGWLARRWSGPPWLVALVEELRLTGELLLSPAKEGRPEEVAQLELPALAHADEARRRLVIAVELADDAEEIAAVLCQELLHDGPLDDELHGLVLALLVKPGPDPVEAWLEDEGLALAGQQAEQAGVARAERRQQARAERDQRRAQQRERRQQEQLARAAEPRQSTAQALSRKRSSPPSKATGGGWIDRVRRAFRRKQGRKSDDESRAKRDKDAQRRAQQRAEAGGGRGWGTTPHPAQPTRGRAHRPPSQARRPPEHESWFRPREAIGPQLDPVAGRDAERRRAPKFGLAFAPAPLPLPYLYGPKQLLGRFHRGRQQWLPAAGQPTWAGAPAGEGAGMIDVRGELPGGESTLPVPLQGTVLGLEAEGGREVRLIMARDGRRAVIAAGGAPIRIEYRVALSPMPELELDDHRAGGGPLLGEPAPLLLERTVADDELPDEALDLVDALLGGPLPPLSRAVAVRDFVRARYRYDPSYLEDPQVAAWLKRVTQGRSNVHVAALHAGRDSRVLGRGVCYELNALCCELLRRVGVPAAVATGWVFDRGQLDEPNHLWAMALVPSSAGAVWYPLDASTTADGRPLRDGDRPPGPWRARRSRRSPRRPPAGVAEPRSALPALAESAEGTPPTRELMRVARHVEALTGERLGDERSLRRRCRELLADRETARALLSLLAGDHDG